MDSPSPWARTERKSPRAGTSSGGGSWPAAVAGPAATAIAATMTTIAAHPLCDSRASTCRAIVVRLLRGHAGRSAASIS
jgi:hypothetical protein